MLQRAVIVAAALAGVLASSASAATVALEEVSFCTDLWGSCRYMQYERGAILIYAGEMGERNRVAVTRRGDGVDLTDGGAQLRAGARCTTSSAGTARCEFDGLAFVGYRLDGGDEADTIAVSGALAPAHAIGEPRLLLGGSGEDLLLGGADAETLAGGPGADRLAGGAGDDHLFFGLIGAAAHADADGAETDIADGGPGLDTANYTLRQRPLHLRLGGQAAGGGEDDEHDRLSSVEQILGGSGNDILIGAAGADRLEGRNGADRVHGAAGNDELIGGLGNDLLFGGDGADRLGTGADGAGWRDRAFCGRGHDVVGELERDDDLGDSWRGPAANDVLAGDCELIPFALPGGVVIPSVDPRPRRRGRHAWEFLNPCAKARVKRCAARIELSLPGRRGAFARSAFTSAPLVKVSLGPIARRRLARARRVAIRLRARQNSSLGARSETAFVLTIRS